MQGNPMEPVGSVPYQEAELRFVRERVSGELDLVFLVDETGSMGAYIEQVKLHLLELVHALRRSPLMKSLRIGLVTYRDHPPQDLTYASRSTDLTNDIASIEREVQSMAAQGGGDGPESVTDGLFDVVRLSWRPTAAKVVVWFGDAPPHGLDSNERDGFPKGCPCGNHWYTQAESCREMGIAVYAIGCLPALRRFPGAEDVFRLVASTTRGTYLPLTRAELLVPLIAGAAAMELDKQRIDERVVDALQRHGAMIERSDRRERVRWITDLLRAEDVRPRDLQWKEGQTAPAPLYFRPLEQTDVEASFERLSAAGRTSPG
jgi:Mg-chelatase subunit ChlD